MSGKRISRHIDPALALPVFLPAIQAVEGCAAFPCNDWFSALVLGFSHSLVSSGWGYS